MPVKANQPTLLTRLRAPPWSEIGPAARERGRGHGRAETRTISVLSLHPRPDLGGEFFPFAAQAIKLVRRRRPRRPGGRWKTVTVYAITSLTAFQADPALLARWRSCPARSPPSRQSPLDRSRSSYPCTLLPGMATRYDHMVASTEKVSLSLEHDALVLARRAAVLEGLSLSAYISHLARTYAWASERPRLSAAEQADADVALTELDERELWNDGQEHRAAG